MNELGISKRLIYPGKVDRSGPGPLNYPKETKFYFHYQIKQFENLPEPVVLDDTRKYGKTMEIYSGKQFQLEAWETCLETMQVGEVAAFVVDQRHLRSFAPINKKLRDYMLDKHLTGQAKHCCGMMSLQEQGGLGYPDLDKLMEKPQSLEFVFELLKIELPGESEKETWAMSPEEKSDNVGDLKEVGNSLIKSGDYEAARIKYGTALELLEQLSLREKPGESEWSDIEKRKIPLLLNMTQSEILAERFYEAINHASEAIKKDPDNVKAHFRRGKACMAVWQLDEAKSDFEKALELDGSIIKSVERELVILKTKRREKMDGEKLLFGNKLINAYK